MGAVIDPKVQAPQFAAWRRLTEASSPWVPLESAHPNMPGTRVPWCAACGEADADEVPHQADSQPYGHRSEPAVVHLNGGGEVRGDMYLTDHLAVALIGHLFAPSTTPLIELSIVKKGQIAKVTVNRHTARSLISTLEAAADLVDSIAGDYGEAQKA